MILRIEPAAATPPYEQLRLQLTAMIVAGVLPDGERLPSIRQLAADLRLAPGTVRRAYTELEREGLVQTRRGRGGSYVAPPQSPRPAAGDRAGLQDAARRYAVAVAQAGVDLEAALAAVRAAVEEVRAAAAVSDPAPAARS